MKFNITTFTIFVSVLLSGSARALTTQEIMGYFLRQKKIEVFAQQQVDEKRAQRWYQYYLTEGKSTLERQMQRAESARPIIETILQEMQVPSDLFFIALVESGFMQQARSSKGALGPWQFMPATARRYGLHVDNELDERLHLHKSTRAAAQYLKDLHHIFNDWNLAAAAYNAGEFRVLDAIRKGKTRSYKELCLGGYLPEETRDYLAKIWVVKALAERAPEFGLSVKYKSSLLEDQQGWRRVSFDRPFPLSTAAFLLDRSVDEILAWNSDMQGDMIPGQKDRVYDLYLPLGPYQRWQQLIGRPIVTKVQDPERLASFGVKGVEKGDRVQMLISLEGTTKIHNLTTGESYSIKLP